MTAQFLRLILTLSAITNQIRVDARRSTYTSSKFGEKFSKIKTRLLEVNYLKTLQWNGGKDEVGINGGRGNLGQNMTQCRILGKFEYTRGPIFKVVLEC